MTEDTVEPARYANTVWGWAIEPELLHAIGVTLIHEERAGDEIHVTLVFKNGREHKIIAGLAPGQWRRAYDAIKEATGLS